MPINKESPEFVRDDLTGVFFYCGSFDVIVNDDIPSDIRDSETIKATAVATRYLKSQCD